MLPNDFTILLLTAGSFLIHGALAAPQYASIEKRVGQPYKDPTTGGGSWLMNPEIPGQGEPLNVIISALSNKEVLTDNGFRDYAKSLGFDTECFGLHRGTRFKANLGDGVTGREERYVLRESFGTSFFGLGFLGTCVESIVGGNHLRMFRQDGPDQGESALFLAVSQERNVSFHHQISDNGYNTGRDLLVMAATKEVTEARGKKYKTTKEDLMNKTAVGTQGINHGVAIDGKVVLLTVNVV